MVLALLLAPSVGWGIESAEPDPGGGRVVPRPGRDRDPNSFRQPGTLLSQAEHHPPQVDPAELRRRKIEQVTNRLHATDGFTPAESTGPAPEAAPSPDAPAEPEDAAAEPAAEANAGGLRTWHILAALALAALALVALFRLTARRR